MSTIISLHFQRVGRPPPPPRLRGVLALALWAGAACLWWHVAPALLGVRLAHPIPVLGLALALPLLALRAAFQAAETARNEWMIGGLPGLSTPVFAVLFLAVLLCPAPVMSYAFGLPVAVSVALISVSDFGLLVVTAPLLAVMLATTEPVGCPPPKQRPRPV